MSSGKPGSVSPLVLMRAATAGLCLLMFWCFMQWPILAGDTDLWFHLDYGRFIVGHRAIPDSSYFSFLFPPIQYLDHPWLFQLLVYGLYQWSGYLGLIVLRAVMYVATIFLIRQFLFVGRQSHHSSIWMTGLFISYSLVLMQRAELVRPHLFTYFFIVAALYVIEYGSHRMLWLLIGAVIWCNMHGYTYPLVVLIGASYAAEYLVLRFTRSLPSEWNDRSFLLPVALAMCAIFVTPFGIRLLDWFSSLTYTSQHTGEFFSISWPSLLSLRFLMLLPTRDTLFNLLFLMALVSAVAALWKKTLRLSHGLLWLGGLVLLAHGNRFASEFALLSLPLLKASPWIDAFSTRTISSWRLWLISGLLAVMPFPYLRQSFSNRPAYPVSYRSLPRGVAGFLKQMDAGGNVLNYPDAGGYLRWALYPKYKIFADMEFPGLTDEVFYLSEHVFAQEVTLRKILSRYDPSFISVPLELPSFGPLIQRVPDYVLVFFDDTEALYVNRRRYPEIADRYALTGVDIFTFAKQSVDEISKDVDGMPLVRHLSRLLAVDPTCAATNQLAALLFQHQGRHDAMLPYASAIIEHFPELSAGYWLQGQAFEGLRAFDRAVVAYRSALQRTVGDERRQVWKRLGFAYAAQGDDRKAYHAFKKSISIFSDQTSLEELYQFAVSARRSGHAKEARLLLQFIIEQRLTPEDSHWRQRIENEMKPMSGAA